VLESIEQAKTASRETTANKAIIWAIRKATKKPDPAPEPSSEDPIGLAVEILRWAERLQFASVRERRELRLLSARLYRLVSRLPQE